MNIQEKIERSKSKEPTELNSKIGCVHQDDPMVLVKTGDKIMVEPVWTLTDDYEGGLYADYIAGHPEYDGIYVRAGLLERLTKAADSLDPNYKLVVRAGHRPLDVQKRILNECMDDYLREHAGSTEEEALQHARLFVSDPEVVLPPHCCGAAVDVELYDNEKQQLADFGSPMNLDEDISYLHYENIPDEARANRLRLLSAMLDAGLVSSAYEWWHFSYGDQVWAWSYGFDDCLYGLVDSPVYSGG